MKLIFCMLCKDIVRLGRETVTCECGESAGRYLDYRLAEVSGPSIAIGVDNYSFAEAIDLGSGNFNAWVIRDDDSWVRRTDNGRRPV